VLPCVGPAELGRRIRFNLTADDDFDSWGYVDSADSAECVRQGVRQVVS
jgi:hypothetical protein